MWKGDAILLSLLENPLQTNKDIAKATGYSPSQVSRILCSPDFLRLYDAAFGEVAHGARHKWLDRLISAIGTKRTLAGALQMSAFRGKATSHGLALNQYRQSDSQ